jgi:UTP--glucose-1-phosphate uridylyltransferase
MINKIKKTKNKEIKITKAIVLLAGYGTRCLPFTKVLPKAMLPILNKPTIHYIIEELEATQIEEVIFVLPKTCNGKIVKEYFSSNGKYEKFLKQRRKQKDLEKLQNIKTDLKIRYVFTSKANGSGGALLSAEKYLKNQTFILLNGDDLFFGKKSIISEMIANYKKYKKNIVVLQEVEENKKNAYGIYAGIKKGDCIKLNKMVEKPKTNEIEGSLAGVGRYLLEKDVFKILKKAPKLNCEIQVTFAFLEYIKQNRLNGIITKQKRIDGGNILELAKASIVLAMENVDYKEHVKEFIKNIKINK